MTTLAQLASSILPSKEAPTSFAVFGRKHYHTGISAPRPAAATKPYFPYHGETHVDWSWKPSPDVVVALCKGARKFAPPAFDQYLATLSESERIRVLTNKHDYERGYPLKIEALQRVVNDQMEGWSDDNS